VIINRNEEIEGTNENLHEINQMLHQRNQSKCPYFIIEKMKISSARETATLHGINNVSLHHHQSAASATSSATKEIIENIRIEMKCQHEEKAGSPAKKERRRKK